MGAKSAKLRYSANPRDCVSQNIWISAAHTVRRKIIGKRHIVKGRKWKCSDGAT